MATLIRLTIFDIIMMLLPIEEPTEDWDAEAEADPEPPFNISYFTDSKMNKMLMET